MQHTNRITFKKELAPLQQDLLNTPTDTVAKLTSQAQAIGIDIRLIGDTSIVISRWQFSREFHNPNAALGFLAEMGVKP
jgi:hypothetical protein